MFWLTLLALGNMEIVPQKRSKGIALWGGQNGICFNLCRIEVYTMIEYMFCFELEFKMHYGYFAVSKDLNRVYPLCFSVI